MGIRDRSSLAMNDSYKQTTASKRQPSPPPGVPSIGPSGDPFHWSPDDEPHKKRRTEILKKYPQIEELFVPTPITFLYVMVYVLLQIVAAYWVESQSYLTLFLLAYFFGGFLNHALNLAAHELSHNLCWQSQTANKLTAILSNLPTGVPSAITFARYHHEHHLYQGYDGIDVDIPTVFECNLFANTLMKTLWIVFQPFAYALRPVFIKPKPATAWEAVNWVICVSFDIAIYTLFGAKAFAYLLASTFLGLGLHPSAGHFIAEHFEFVRGQETYSYYGILNLINFNVGYHNEHHDFPRCPWVNLPKVKAIAPEFYDMPSYHSYLSVMWNYITDPTMGPFSRIKRRPQSPDKAGKQKTTLFAIVAVAFLVSGISFPVIKAYYA